MKDKVLSYILIGALFFSAVSVVDPCVSPAVVFAENSDTASAEGTIGSGSQQLNWKYQGITLTISGHGAMKDYESAKKQPWYGKAFSQVVIEEGVTSIGNFAFAGSDVVSLSCPSTMTKIGISAFSGCDKLSVPGTLGATKSIGSKAFYGCSALKNIRISDNCSIAKNAFTHCSGQLAVIMGDQCTISESAFYDAGLVKVEMGNDALIGKQAFANNSDLAEVVIGHNSIVASKAFYNDNDISKLSVGQNTSFGSSVFSSCAKVNELSIMSTMAPSNGKSVFPRLDANRVQLYVPLGAVRYNQGFWKQFKTTYNRDADIVVGKRVGRVKIKGISVSGSKVKSKKVTVEFGAVKGAKKYKIQYSDRENFAEYKEKTVTKTTFSFTNNRNNPLYVRVCAIKNVSGVSATGTWSQIEYLPIYKIRVSLVELEKTTYSYDGKVHVPAVKAKTESGRSLIEGTDFDVAYSDSDATARGTYKVKVAFKSTYAENGTKVLYYKIK